MSVKAVEYTRNLGRPVFLSLFNIFEYENALRLAGFRKLIGDRERIEIWKLFHAALSAGRLVYQEANLAEVLAEARRLSESHTPSGGHRGFDILHVAAAKQMGAGDFLTFDRNQRKLARSLRLKIPL